MEIIHLTSSIYIPKARATRNTLVALGIRRRGLFREETPPGFTRAAFPTNNAWNTVIQKISTLQAPKMVTSAGADILLPKALLD